MDNFWRNKRVLITGANGFLGSHLSIALLKKEAFIIGIIKEDPKYAYLKIALNELFNPKIKLIKSDIVNFKSLSKIFKDHKPDICMHVAAQPIVGIANKSPLSTFEANIKGTWNILELARLYKTKAVIVASSDKAYGEHKKLPYKEDAALLALHPYDASKACADMLTRCYAHTYSLNTAVTRCANIYGPGDFNFSRIIPDTIRLAILNQNPVIRSDGTPLRDYIFINDIVDGYLIFSEKLYCNKIKPGEVFNFGTGRPISVLNLVNKILLIAKKQKLKPKILSKGKIKGEIDKQYLSSSKAKALLGWKCRKSLTEGLKITYTWYANHLKH
ncbi:MAG: GDP-mannose 4,6-dehydratase [Candidatus Omnitrophota bacterium]|nr:GDP-mannose 4,6-dehydratase [Candidatus Omnitrophota bacterium]